MKEFVCVKYPGYIKNIDKVIESMEGMNKLEECFLSENTQNTESTLELR